MNSAISLLTFIQTMAMLIILKTLNRAIAIYRSNVEKSFSCSDASTET